MTVETRSDDRKSDQAAAEQQTQAGEQVRSLSRGMKDVGRHIWLAGLGAIGTVDQQGRGLFSDLVDRGRRLEDRERPALEERFRKAGERVDDFRRQVERGVETRVASALQRFGVPDRGEVHQLIDRIEKLTRQVEGLAASSK